MHLGTVGTRGTGGSRSFETKWAEHIETDTSAIRVAGVRRKHAWIVQHSSLDRSRAVFSVRIHGILHRIGRSVQQRTLK